MTNTTNIDQIVKDILADMSLKKKATIANLNEDKVPYLKHAFDTCICSQLGKVDEKLIPDQPYERFGFQ